MADDAEIYGYPTCAVADWLLQQLRKFASEGKVVQVSEKKRRIGPAVLAQNR